MATEKFFRSYPYAHACDAQVVAVNDRGGIILDRTVFYPTGGGQPGDSGTLELTGGQEIEIVTTVKGSPEDGKDTIVHVPAEGSATPAAGDSVIAKIDWERRHRHTGGHLPHVTAGVDAARIVACRPTKLSLGCVIVLRWIALTTATRPTRTITTMTAPAPRATPRSGAWAA